MVPTDTPHILYFKADKDTDWGDKPFPSKITIRQTFRYPKAWATKNDKTAKELKAKLSLRVRWTDGQDMPYEKRLEHTPSDAMKFGEISEPATGKGAHLREATLTIDQKARKGIRKEIEAFLVGLADHPGANYVAADSKDLVVYGDLLLESRGDAIVTLKNTISVKISVED